MASATTCEELKREGRVWFRAALSEADLALLDAHCPADRLPGRRLGWSDSLAALLDAGSQLGQLACGLLPAARPVRVVAFNKSSEGNWLVPWHQDRVIAVQERQPVDGYRNWSRKAGTWHVEPPLALLQEMIFARVHLDDTDESNGCLELALGSHRLGHVDAAEAAAAAKTVPHELCRARRGDVLFVKALCLHRSRPSTRALPRRTLRIDYSAARLPSPLHWAMAPDAALVR